MEDTSFGHPETTSNKKKYSWLVRFRLCDGGWRNSLLFHPVGLRTQDEAEKVVIWNSGSWIGSRWSSTSLIVQPGALKRAEISSEPARGELLQFKDSFHQETFQIKKKL